MVIQPTSTISEGPGRWRAVAAASIGNALEWFDYIIYGYFAAHIAKQFFPLGSDVESLLVAFATFGITFLVRPFGAIVLGVFADRHGRKAALVLAISLMMLGTAMIAVTPGYAVIGLWAPAVIVVARLVQGISAGGEFGSATAFLAEQDPKRRGYFASWQFASQGMTTVLAAATGTILADVLTGDQMAHWGWRIPFVIGLLIGPIAYYLRRAVDETSEFRAMAEPGRPLRDLSQAKLRLLVSVGAVVLCTVAMYTTLFMPSFAMRQLGLPQAGSFLATLLAGAFQIALVPSFGAISDRFGRLSVMVPAAIAMLLISYPMFAWMSAVPTLQTLLFVQIAVGVVGAAYMGPLPALMSELFPARMRTTGLAVSYSLSVAIFGGFAPFANVWLIRATGSNVAPGFYLMGAAAISLATLALHRRLRF
ncbi:MAG TPA: MFS transporter [Pseudolabrys sp.]|uniref:MFS transporter n=1 Tax=Pseudolabrys sp. TaxID=1960880 RepID=UPI002DDD0950|nr:MFS transporter [Pseudolabrys sp.]HEV2629864.1 MFS transporter [Pseudolabrys sp.]